MVIFILAHGLNRGLIFGIKALEPFFKPLKQQLDCKNKKAFPVKETLFHNVIKNYLAKSNTKLKRIVFESGLRLTPEPEGNR